MSKSFEIISDEGNLLRASLFGESLPVEAPRILYFHGFKGFKDWGFVPFMAEFFASKGFKVLTFNFSHNGIGEDLLNFTEEDKFEQNTHSLELSEAKQMVRKLRGGSAFGLPESEGIGVIGHSRGGGVALLAGAAMQSIKAVVTWASVASYERYPSPLLEHWRKTGYIEIPNTRTGQVFKMGLDFLEDLDKHKEGKLNILKAAKLLGKPLCIIHGDQDEAVKPKDAHALFDAANSDFTELHTIMDAGHTFEIKHPFAGSSKPFDLVLDHSLHFLNRHLNPIS